jgi:rubrerythrin
MTEEPVIIQMNISHYSAMLKLNLDDETRSVVNRLIAEAREHLALAILEREQQRPRCERELNP